MYSRIRLEASFCAKVLSMTRAGKLIGSRSVNCVRAGRYFKDMIFNRRKGYSYDEY